MLTDLCSFLDIDPARLPAPVSQRNVTHWVRNLWLKKLSVRGRGLKQILPERLARAVSARLHTWNRVQPPPLAAAVRSSLTACYQDEILRLQALIERDLSHWLPGAQL